MTNILYSTEQAVLSALTGNAGVQAELGNPARVYDTHPAGAAFPFAVMGATHATARDSKSDTGFDLVISFDVYSRAKGGQETRDVMIAFYNALHRASLSVAGANYVSCEFHDADFQLQIDDFTYHAAVRFAVRVG